MTRATSIRSSLVPWSAGWGLVALGSTLSFELTVSGVGGGGRHLAHVHVVALHVALALACTAVVDAGRHLIGGPSRRLAAALAIGAAVGALVIEDDFRGLAERLPGSLELWSHGLGIGLGLAAIAAFVVGARAARMGRWALGLAVTTSLVVSASHHHVLTSGYDGIHLAAVLSAASLAAGALDAWRTSRGTSAGDTAATRRVRGRSAVLVAAAAALVGAGGVVVDPGSGVVVAARRLPGHAVPAFAARGRQLMRARADGLDVDSAWLRDRAALRPVAPTDPPLVPRGAIIVLITIDAVRAEVLRDPMLSRFPTLERLAGASHVFTRARSAAPHTTPSLAGMLMGKYYSQVVWEQRKSKGPKPYTDRSPTIASVLAEHGVPSAAYPALGQVSEEYGLGRGFTEPAKRTHGAGKIVSAIVKRVRAADDRGLFVYTHIMEPHAPYDGAGETDFERYLDEIARVDRALKPLVELTLDSELSDRIVLVVTADHGEAFGEHGSTQHGTTLYEEMVRVPLLVRIPGSRKAASDVPVSLVDVGPTVLDLLGAHTPASFMGSSLVPILAGEDAPLDRPLVLESGRMMRAIIEEDRWKLIGDRRHGTVELYDLEVDPLETNDLFEHEPERAARLAGFLDTFFDVHAYRAPGYEIPYFP